LDYKFPSIREYIIALIIRKLLGSTPKTFFKLLFFTLFLLVVLEINCVYCCQESLFQPNVLETVFKPIDGVVDSVVIVITNAHKQWLFAKRGIESSGTGEWALVGGKIDAGESPLQAAQRETREETSSSLTNVSWLFTTLTHDDAITKNAKTYRVYVLKAQLTSDPKISEPLKVPSFKWFDLGTLPENLFGPTKIYEKQLLESIKEAN
jgi:8-oxo-dGTP diphosphatase